MSNLLGSAWVEKGDIIKLTEVGWELLDTTEPERLIERQVRKYQLGNPQTSKTLTSDISVIPHYVLLELLIRDYPVAITGDEFIRFVSRIPNHKEVPNFRSLLNEYRELSLDDKQDYNSLLNDETIRKVERDFSYAANFLAFPGYLEYKPARISVQKLDEAKRVLAWYHQGHDSYIDFRSLKDWFFYYGRTDSRPDPLSAADYYRSIGDVEQAVVEYRKAVEKGLAPLEDTPEDYRCRVNGEAIVEAWLMDNLERLEPGLRLIGNQYETEDAGRIDILAKDSECQYVIIELKRDKASDAALGQLLRYIGWVRMNLAGGGYVRGFVVGDSIDERMVYAILAHNDIDEMCKLKQYQELGIKLLVERTEGDCYAEVQELPAESS